MTKFFKDFWQFCKYYVRDGYRPVWALIYGVAIVMTPPRAIVPSIVTIVFGVIFFLTINQSYDDYAKESRS